MLGGALSGLAQPHLDAYAGSASHVHGSVEGEEVDLAAHQVRDARLCYAEEPGRLSLAELGVGDVLLSFIPLDGIRDIHIDFALAFVFA